MLDSRTDEQLKQTVHEFWTEHACGTEWTDSEKFSRAYFDEIEEARYRIEPEIHAFAQFTRAREKKVLEVGVGASTDFLQWVRAGAQAHGIDLTQEAIDHARQRLAVYGLEAADLRPADCEALPFDDDSFDLVYSWGVIHHTPDTFKALREIARVTRPGGRAKVMVYNRRSLWVLAVWVRHALLTGRPWKSRRWVMHNKMESLGTKSYTREEIREALAGLPVGDAKVETIVTYYDRLEAYSPWLQRAASLLLRVLGPRDRGYFLTIEFTKR
jgi:ubiquinone/menaquinone biosynthesis C-methylase UbiE